MNCCENSSTLYDDNYDIVEPCGLENHDKVGPIVRLYVHSVICLLGFIGNALVIVTYAFYKKSKSMTDVYLLNVAIADMLFVVSLPFIIYNEQSGWAMGMVMCKLLRGAYSVNLFCTMLLLACISTDRYIAIVQARRSFRLRSRSLAYSRLICSVVWVLALLLSVPTLLFYQTYVPSHTNYTNFEAPYTDDSAGAWQENEDHLAVCHFWFADNETAHLLKILVPSVQIALGFFLPLLTMCFCYLSVIVTLLRARNLQRHKAVRVVMAVVLVFLCCHLPYNAALLYDTTTMFVQQKCNAVDAINVALTVTETIAYLHCCLNPVLYAYRGEVPQPLQEDHGGPVVPGKEVHAAPPLLQGHLRHVHVLSPLSGRLLQ
ncbi:LOW QUALITY PROTEIN: C-C chemokine receptor type 6a [Aplochiton taeniatus]